MIVTVRPSAPTMELNTMRVACIPCVTGLNGTSTCTKSHPAPDENSLVPSEINPGESANETPSRT